MINKFTEFISDDPMMLALCVIIIALIVVFILVLVFGKSKGDKKSKNAVKENVDNTTSLLTSDISDDELKSTKTFQAIKEEKEKELTDSKRVPVISDNGDITEANAPINITEAMNLKSVREKDKDVPKINSNKNIDEMWNKANVGVAPKKEITVKPVGKVETFDMDNTPEKKSSIFEKLTTKKTPEKTNNTIDSAKPDVIAPETKKETKPKMTQTQQFSSVALNGGVLPKANNEENLTKTQIIRHVEPKVEPVKEEVKPLVKEEPKVVEPEIKPSNLDNTVVKEVEKTENITLDKLKNTSLLSTSILSEPDMPKLDEEFKTEDASDDDLDDIELPKFNTTETKENSALSNLSGETFDLK